MNPPPPSSGAHPGSSLVPLVTPTPDDLPTVITGDTPAQQSGVAVGETLGNFQVTGTVGVGGMAAVLRATDRELGREVALKILPAAMTRDADAVARFKAEARSAARLDHENIARVFACGEDRGRHFIAFEFVEGDNLRTLIERRGPLPATECVQLLLQLAAGLGHAASRGVVHRDIKPSNVVITPDGRAKIVDMGLARNLDQPANGGVTQSGVTLGTFDYISPEQALDPRQADVRSDIYSLGCAFYHALTGRPPVPEGTAARKLSAHAHDPVLDPRELNPAVPDGLAVVLAKMMAKSAAQRYQTPDELRIDLERLARDLDPAGPAEATPPGDRGSLALVAGVLVAGAGLAFALGLVLRPPPAEPAAPPFAPALPRGLPPALAQLPEPVPPPPATTATVEGVPQLLAALADPSVEEVRLAADRTFDLSAPAAVAPRARLTVQGLPGRRPARLRLRADAPLRLEGVGRVVLQGVVVAVGQSAALSPVGERPAGLEIAGATQVEVSECRFEPDPTAGVDTASIGIRHAATPAAQVRFGHCYFAPSRGVGVQCLGGVELTVRETAFAPLTVAIALGPLAGRSPELTLSSSSFLFRQGSAVETAGTGVVRHEHCVFAATPPDATDMMLDDPDAGAGVVVRSTRDRLPTLAGRADRASLVYRVDPVATPTERVGAADAILGGSAGLAEVAVSPWATPDPVPQLALARPWEAFRLSMSLRAARAPYPVRVVGAVELPTRDRHIYDPWPPAAVEARAGRTRAVCPDPAVVPELKPGEYRTLAEALAAAQPGEVVEIRHAGRLEIDPIAWDRDAGALTVRAAPGTRPVLVPNPNAGAELVRLIRGSLTLENLDLTLTAPSRVAESSLVTVAGGTLALKSCRLTLPATESRQLAAIGLVNTPDPAPAVTLTDCVVRGSGSGVRVTALQGAGLTMQESLVALTGPLLEAKPTAPAPTRLTLDRVTALLEGPLVQIDTGLQGENAFVEIDLKQSLVNVLNSSPVVELRGPGAGRVRNLKWQSDAPTAVVVSSPFAPWGVFKSLGMADRLDRQALGEFLGRPLAASTLPPVTGVPASLAATDPATLRYPPERPATTGADLGRLPQGRFE